MRTISLLIFAFLLICACGDGKTSYRGKVVHKGTGKGITGIVIYCSFYGPPESQGIDPYYSGKNGQFSVVYSDQGPELTPRICRFQDEDGKSNGGQFGSKNVDPPMAWYPNRGEEQIVELYEDISQ
jgi:hypothetical protein